jgi:hypothetical protein
MPCSNKYIVELEMPTDTDSSNIMFKGMKYEEAFGILEGQLVSGRSSNAIKEIMDFCRLPDSFFDEIVRTQEYNFFEGDSGLDIYYAHISDKAKSLSNFDNPRIHAELLDVNYTKYGDISSYKMMLTNKLDRNFSVKIKVFAQDFDKYTAVRSDVVQLKAKETKEETVEADASVSPYNQVITFTLYEEGPRDIILGDLTFALLFESK